MILSGNYLAYLNYHIVLYLGLWTFIVYLGLEKIVIAFSQFSKIAGKVCKRFM